MQSCAMQMGDSCLFQAGGFSANGQPIDQVHHLLRSQLEVLDAEDVGYGMDLRLRPGYLVRSLDIAVSCTIALSQRWDLLIAIHVLDRFMYICIYIYIYICIDICFTWV